MIGAARRSRGLACAIAIAFLLLSCTVPPLPQILSPATPAPEEPRPVSVLVLGPDGGVPGANVCAERPGREARCAKSGGDGRASLELVPGTYAIRATPAEGRRLEEGVVGVDISSSASVTVTLRGRSTIAGTVRDPEGRGVRGAEACAHSTISEDVECARTAADGGYLIEIPPGVHKISFTGPADGSRLMPQWARGRIDSAEADAIDTRSTDVAGVEVTLARGVVLSGTITGGGRPLESAQLCTYTLAAPLGWNCAETDRRGRYAALREPGEHWVWAIPPDQHGSRLIPQRYDRVLVGVDATPFALREDRSLDMALPEGVVLSGTVTTADGAPVALALVCADTPFPTGRICRGTGDDGHWELATRPEAYVVSVVPPDESDVIGGYVPGPVPDWTKAQRIPVRQDTRLDITLPRGVRFYGRVWDPRGVPVEAATVNLNDAGGPRFFAVTDIHGRFSVAVLPGSYTVDVFAPRAGYLMSVVERTVLIESDVGYELVLPDVVVEP